MKKLYYFIIIILFSNFFRESYSQNPSYQLRLENISFTNGCGYWNSIDFDIYMQNTSGSPLEYSAGQYFINFNPAIANGGTLTYQIVGSDLPSNMQPRNPSIGTVPESPGGVLRMAANTAPPPGSGYFISSSYPGTKIVRMRLKTTAIELTENLQPAFTWRNSPSLPYTSIFAYVNGVQTDITNNNSHAVQSGGSLICFGEQIPWCSCRFTHSISINSIIEGLYDPQTNRLNRKDTLTVEMRSGASPYNLYSSNKLTLDSLNFSSYNVFSVFPPDNAGYFIAMKHFNSIETWSKLPSQYGSHLNYYDFTNSAQSAYGNNLKLKGTKYTMYSGDVNQDKVIDALDQGLVDTDANNFAMGRFLPADLNGDNIVDVIDVQIADNNVYNYVTAVTP